MCRLRYGGGVGRHAQQVRRLRIQMEKGFHALEAKAFPPVEKMAGGSALRIRSGLWRRVFRGFHGGYYKT